MACVWRLVGPSLAPWSEPVTALPALSFGKSRGVTVPATAPSVLTFSAVGLTWPDGTVAFDGLDLLVSPGRAGLVGANGSGKSTLLRLAAGVLQPTRGSVSVAGEVGYLPQDLVLDRSRRVDDVLGIGTALRALRALDAGSGDPRDLEAVGDQWDVEERAVAELERLGLPASVLDRRLGELSGGEAVRLGLARLLLRRPDVLLLDEPTNNLDAAARSRLHDVLGSWPRTLLVVSHDRELLERVDRIGELRDGAVRWYGGGFSSYADQVRAEQDAAEQAVTAASSDVRRQRADRVEAERVVAQRKRQGERNAVRTNMGKAARDYYKNRSEKSASSYRKVHDERLDAARNRLEDAEARLREDRTIRVDLPATEVPRGRVVLTTDSLVIRTGAPIELDLRGPDRIAVAGPNGAGKTTLLGHHRRRAASACRVGPHPCADRAAPPTTRPPRPRALGGGQRRPPRARPRPEPDPRAAGPLPVPRRDRRPAGRHAVGRRAVPRHPGGAAARRPGTSAAVARRADEQPRPGVVRRARVGALGVPRCAAGGQPRRPVPRGHRGSPDAGGQSSAMIEKMLPAGSVNQAMSGPPPRNTPFSSVSIGVPS